MTAGKSTTAAVLVTGGLGYIGSHTCTLLAEAGYRLVVVDNLSNSKPEVLERLSALTGAEIRFEPLDLRNRYVRPGGPPLMVDYAMHKTPEGWKIFDVAVEGISLLMVYRAEFAEQLRRVAIDELIQGLSEKNEARAELR